MKELACLWPWPWQSPREALAPSSKTVRCPLSCSIRSNDRAMADLPLPLSPAQQAAGAARAHAKLGGRQGGCGAEGALGEAGSCGWAACPNVHVLSDPNVYLIPSQHPLLPRQADPYL